MTRLMAMAAGLGLLVLPSCGAGFKAVDAASALGQKIDGSIAKTAPAELCADLRALAPATECKETSEWGDVTDAIVTYAAKLSALATKDDVDPRDAIESSLSAASDAKLIQLSSDRTEAIAGFAKAVVKALSMAYRADVLNVVIKDVDPHLQLVGALLRGEIDLKLQQIEQLASATARVQRTLAALPKPRAVGTSAVGPSPAAEASPAAAAPAVGSDPKLVAWIRDQEAINQVNGQAASVGIVALLQDLEAKKRAYLELRANVSAFCAAHAKLAGKADDLNAKELLPQIIGIAKEAAALRKTFTSSTTSAPAGN
jgi:hypothetical protein